MAWTQTDLDAVKAAIASGERRVRFADGRETEYRSVDELKKAKAAIEAELGIDSGATPRTRQIRLYSTKGF
jgi:hypothetical protein